MAEQRATRPATLAGGAARSGAPGGRRAGPAQDLRRRGARASARPTRCCRRPGPSGRTAYDVVVGVVETHGRKETEALLDGLEVIPRRRVDVQGHVARGDGPRCRPRAPPAARAGRRARPHQRAGQPPSQALSRRRGTAERRHRRLHDGQHPAHREPERRRRADHARARARDRAGLRSSTAPTPSSWSTSRPTT